MDFGTLKARIESTAHRTFPVTDLDGFVDMAMERISHELMSIEALTTATIDPTVSLALPVDYGRMQYVTRQSGSGFREIKPISALEAQKWSESASESLGYRINGAEIEFYPAYTGLHTIVYYRRPGALAADPDTNYVTDNYERLALYGSLIESAIWEQNTDAASTYTAVFDTAIKTANQDAQRQQYGTGIAVNSLYSVPGQVTRTM